MARWPARILLAVVATAASLGVGEVAVRLAGAAPGFAAIPFGQYATSADPELLWEPRPGAAGVNAEGLRGAELDGTASRPRLLVLGDSIAWGIDLADDETIPVRLEAHLAARGHALEVLNGGVSGYNTVQEARRLELLAPRLGLEHVVLLVCVNDVESTDELPEGVLRFARRNAAAEALGRVHGLSRGSRLRRELMSRSHLFRLAHETFVRRSPSSTAAAPSGDGDELAVVRAGLDRIAAAAARHGFDVTVAAVPLLADLASDQPQRRIQARVLDLARERGLDALDLLPVATGSGQRALPLLGLPGDPLHPNAAGADLFAAAIAARCSAGALSPGRAPRR